MLNPVENLTAWISVAVPGIANPPKAPPGSVQEGASEPVCQVRREAAPAALPPIAIKWAAVTESTGEISMELITIPVAVSREKLMPPLLER
jgi:hypothetical protein